jgi:RNA polymerase sigma factor (sigma-70 family)
MAALHDLVRHLRRWAGPVRDDTTPDRALLARFAAGRDEDAFVELVRRHGPMVLGVARRVLHDRHDAEDVFQAAFLVLARKAAVVPWRASVGGWLFPVAYRLALKVRAGRQRRRFHEAQVRTMAEPDPPPPDGDLRAILDEELARLPDHYRSVVVLCYLQEKTQREAARQLGLTPGEVRGRLDRARGRLRQRLARRGLALSGAAVAAALTARTTSAAVPPPLAAQTARAAALFAAAAPAGLAAVATPRAVALAKGALHTMPAVKTTKLLFVLLAVGLLGAGALLLPLPPLGGDPGPGPRQAADNPDPPAPKVERVRRHCIILWLSGGPSQLDTWDPKPGQVNGGPFQAIDTRVKGVRLSEHLPLLAERTDRLAIIRSLTHNDGDHGRATFLMHTGRQPEDRPDSPSLGALLAKELRDPRADLPAYVTVTAGGPFLLQSTGPGFLGDAFEPLSVTAPSGRQVSPAVPLVEAFARIDKDRAEAMHRAAGKALDLKEETAELRGLYGRNDFGQGCLLARRLVERGTAVVEVSFGGWDTHGNNFEAVKTLSQKLDAGFAFLLKDLEDRKLLDSTLVVCMGEFGRTPKINANQGRDHWMRGFSVALAGAGVKGGQVIGRTSDDGTAIVERPVAPPELLATICRALHVDPSKENRTDRGQAVPLVDKGTEPVLEALK